MQGSAIGRTAAVVLAFSVMLSCNMPGGGEQRAEGDGGNDRTRTNTPAGAGADDATLTPTQPPATPTATTEPSETPAPTATSGADFSSASIYAISHLEGESLLVTVKVPGGGFEESYEGRVGPSVLSCEELGEYPDRLYCSGPEPFENYSTKSAPFQLYGSETASPVFETEVDIPPRATPTPPPSETPEPTATISLDLDPIFTPPPIFTPDFDL